MSKYHLASSKLWDKAAIGRDGNAVYVTEKKLKLKKNHFRSQKDFDLYKE